SLDWLAGNWVSRNGEQVVEVSAQWNSAHTYLLRELKVSQNDKIMFRGTQRIGWDPGARQIRSWTFDADGGYGEGTWTPGHGFWIIEATGVLTDGRRTASTNVLSPDGKDGFTLKSIAGHSDGRAMPDREIKFKRVATTGS